jgi:hypothetical protein
MTGDVSGSGRRNMRPYEGSRCRIPWGDISPASSTNLSPLQLFPPKEGWGLPKDYCPGDMSEGSGKDDNGP